MNFGFVKVGACSPQIKVGDVEFNVKKIISSIEDASKKNVEVLVFPALSITGSTLGELFLFDNLLERAKEGLKNIAESTKYLETLVFVGMPLLVLGNIYSVAVAVSKGKVLGFVPSLLENKPFSSEINNATSVNFYGEDIPFSKNLIFADATNTKFKVAVDTNWEINSSVPSSVYHAQNGAKIIVNLSSMPYNLAGREDIKRNAITLTKRLNVSYIFSNSGYGESTTDFVFAGNNLIAENGEILCENKPFIDGLITSQIDLDSLSQSIVKVQGKIEDYKYIEFCVQSNQIPTRKYDKYPFIPKEEGAHEEIIEIQAEGLKKRIEHTFSKKLILGLSGGLDSTLALLVCVRAMEKLNRPLKDIIAVTMPCFGTTSRTLENSIKLAKTMGVSLKKIDISKSVLRHLKDIGHSGETFDPAYENAQARERTQVLMDLANMHGGLVVGTGDMSELALGWATYNGDHMSMYGVNAGVPKTLVKFITSEYAKKSKTKLKYILLDILDTPVSPELIPTDENAIKQKTEDIVGPYVLHDFFLYHLVFNKLSPKKVCQMAISTFDGDFDKETIVKWLATFIKRFFSQQFKRSCLPDGVAVSKYSLSPRQGFKMPSDAVASVWLDEIKNV